MTRPKRTPRVYFSFRSPYSWMAVERLARVIPEPHGTLEFVPYWDPDAITEQELKARGGTFHYVQMSKAKHLYLLHDTKRLAARLGLTMRWPIDIDPWWELPHLGFLKARELGAEWEFYREVIAARWERGENVCEADVLAAVARRAGLDPDVIVSAPDDLKVRAAGVECLYRAYEEDIFGIPYFRVSHHRFWGLDRLDDFLNVLQKDLPGEPLRVPVGPDGAPIAPLDTDTAGGCG